MGNAPQRDNAIGQLERTLLAKPDNLRAAKRLVELLEAHRPSVLISGRYTDCQRTLESYFRQEGWLDELFTTEILAARYRSWQSLLDAKGVSSSLPVAQLYAGRLHTIKGEDARCGARLTMFKEKGVISRLCHECYKVQILPVDLVGLMQTYFVFRKLKLPNDNARKCMVELREDVAYPYKGYIYCSSEEEVRDCLEQFRQMLGEVGLSRIHCGISHGCSEYGLLYPEFKYSEDGAHRSFERPAGWDRQETVFWAGVEESEPVRVDYNNEGMSLRDVIGLRTWIDYAETIGDISWRMFRDRSPTVRPVQFTQRVAKQAHIRKAQLEELREKHYSAT